ncbi:hypothetical protein ACA910_021488 [Epithemia clementina (nom. ined.)]
MRCCNLIYLKADQPEAVVHFAPDPDVDGIDPEPVAAVVDPNPQLQQEEVDEIINLFDDGLFDNIWNQNEGDELIVEEEIN